MCSIWLLCFALGVIAAGAATSGGSQLSPEHTAVWGPGLRAEAVLPARYFYVQAVDTEGQKFTSSPGENAFQVKITAPDEQFTRVGVQVLDRKDGSFIVRYRMYASYKNLKIEIKTRDKHVAKSPYILKGLYKDIRGTCWLQNFHGCHTSFFDKKSENARCRIFC